MAVTVSSLALAAAMTVVAWRLARDEQQRAAGRERDAPVVRDAAMSTAVAPNTRQSRPALLVVVGLAIAGVVAALAVPLGGGVATGASAVDAPNAPATTHSRVELIALDHYRSADQLTVHGIVRNPGRTEINHLAAVVALFDREGALLTSARADIERLGPSGEAPFSITVSDTGLIGRYRVSFLQGDIVVPQVDRRNTAR